MFSGKINISKLGFKSPYSHVYLGLLILYVFLFLLEISVPFFFTCDDNFHQFMPVIIEAYRSLTKGVFPLISPSIYMGYPTTSLGTYSILNPVLYLSYLISRTFFNEFYTIEVYAFINFTIGFIIMYRLLRYLDVDKNSSLYGGLSFIICNPVIGISKNWYYFMPTTVFIPLITYLTIRFYRDKTYKSMVYLALASGIFFYMGNAQMWVYTVMLSGVLFFFIHRNIKDFIKIIPKLSLNYLIVLAVIFPLLFAQILTIHNIERYGSSWANLFDAGGIKAMILPGYSIYCHSGAVLLIISLFGYFFKEARAFFLMALLSFTFALGSYGFIYDFVHSLPFLNKFTHSYKFLVFVSFYSIITACLIIKKFRFGYVLAAFNLMFLVYNHYTISMNNNFFYTYPTEKPYPEMFEETEIVRQGQRFLTASLERPRGTGDVGGCSNTNHVTSLNNNYAAYYGMSFFRGYNDYLIAGSEEVRMSLRRLVDTPVEALRKFGIDTVVKCRDLKELYVVDRRSSIIDFERLFPQIEPSLRLVYRDNHVEIYKFDDAEPLAFTNVEDKHIPVKYKFDTQGAKVFLDNKVKEGGVVIVNLLYRPLYIAYDDLGRELELSADEWGRMQVKPLNDSKEIFIKYSPFSFSNFRKAIEEITNKLQNKN